jgi:hypothetical protein
LIHHLFNCLAVFILAVFITPPPQRRVQPPTYSAAVALSGIRSGFYMASSIRHVLILFCPLRKGKENISRKVEKVGKEG